MSDDKSYVYAAYQTAKESKSRDDSRDAVDEVHLVLVADARQICTLALTVSTS